MLKKSLCIAAAVTALTLVGSWRAEAQLAAPGESGVVQGHLHLSARDPETAQKFWAMLGGTPVQNGTLQLIQFPGTFVMVRKAEPTGGTVGSTVEHFGFHVKNLNESLARWQASPIWQTAGVKWAPTNATQGFLTGPDDVRIEVIQNTAIDTPIRFHHVHFFTASATDTQAWYARTFGAVPGKRASFDTADLPGVNLTFSKADGPVVGTKGRSLDHIGFEVRNLEQFIKRLEASGIKMDRPYTKIANSATAIAFLTDPSGTYIELTENLAPAK
jgi:catechol 2,3-dioxygenase-like lactoylglutathione lyase family enzyme